MGTQLKIEITAEIEDDNKIIEMVHGLEKVLTPLTNYYNISINKQDPSTKKLDLVYGIKYKRRS